MGDAQVRYHAWSDIKHFQVCKVENLLAWALGCSTELSASGTTSSESLPASNFPGLTCDGDTGSGGSPESLLLKGHKQLQLCLSMPEFTEAYDAEDVKASLKNYCEATSDEDPFGHFATTCNRILGRVEKIKVPGIREVDENNKVMLVSLATDAANCETDETSVSPDLAFVSLSTAQRLFWPLLRTCPPSAIWEKCAFELAPGVKEKNVDASSKSKKLNLSSKSDNQAPPSSPPSGSSPVPSGSNLPAPEPATQPTLTQVSAPSPLQSE